MSFRLFGIIFLAGLLSSCGGKGENGAWPTSVEVAEVMQESIRREIPLVGTLYPDEQVSISSEIDGSVESVLFEEGALAAKGEVLFQYDSTRLESLNNASKADHQLAKLNLERIQNLAAKKLISTDELDTARTEFAAKKAAMEVTERNLKDAVLTAPFAGIIGSRKVSPGQVVKKNDSLVELVRVDPLKIELSVPERYASDLKVGQEISVSVEASPDKKFSGSIYFVSPIVDQTSRAVLVKGRVENKALRLRPGMFAESLLNLETIDNALMIPEEAVSFHADEASTYVVSAEMTAEHRVLQLGERSSGRVQVVSGLAAGEKVVTQGAQKLRPGAKIAIVED